MPKPLLNFDEREMNVFRSICTVMYLVSLFALMGIQLYRQFVLHQPQQQWDDIAMLISVNVIVLLGGGLYLSGAASLNNIKTRHLVIGYAAFVLLGLLFTIFKYAVLLGQHVGMAEVWDYVLTILPDHSRFACRLGSPGLSRPPANGKTARVIQRESQRGGRFAAPSYNPTGTHRAGRADRRLPAAPAQSYLQTRRRCPRL